MICQFADATNPYNSMCNNCYLFLETCVPIHSADGYCLGECDIYLCEGCHIKVCSVDTERDRTA